MKSVRNSGIMLLDGWYVVIKQKESLKESFEIVWSRKTMDVNYDRPPFYIRQKGNGNALIKQEMI